jgi:arylsulfatase A-like enzyme
MLRPTVVKRAIVVVLDGLRPDAITAFDLTHVRRLAQLGASTMRARTISPSITWSALTSLLTGVRPQLHGVLSDSVHLPQPRIELTPLPEILLAAGMPSSAFLGELPAFYRMFASRIAERLGFSHARFSGTSASEVLLAALGALRVQREGLIFLHLADADRAGHAYGWMSPQYGEAARRVDTALGQLAAKLDIEHDESTVLIALADHGGGGIVLNEHEEDHPLNTTIPMVIAGGTVRHLCMRDASLLDVPATVAWVLGGLVPDSYSGRALVEIFGDNRPMFSAVNTVRSTSINELRA